MSYKYHWFLAIFTLQLVIVDQCNSVSMFLAGFLCLTGTNSECAYELLLYSNSTVTL